MKYETGQLPYDDFKRLGMDRDAVLSLPKSTMNALLSGNRSSLIRFDNVNLNNGQTTALDAKISLKQMDNGELSLLVHPINEKLYKTWGLSKKDIQHLKENDLSFLPVTVQKGDKTMDALLTYDATTNEIIAIDKQKLKAPDEINNVRLDINQKERFLSGKKITVNGKTYSLNPHNELGIEGKDLESVKIGHSAYRMPNLGIDAVVITAGLGHYVMLYHLANMLLNTRLKYVDIPKSLNNENFRNALIEARNEIIQKQDYLVKGSLDENNKQQKLSIDEIKDILEKKAGEHVVFKKVETAAEISSNDELTSIKTALQKDDTKNDLPINEEKPKSYSFKM